ncbi:MAG: hypothetical protein ACREI2_14445, partial [Nitrospiraceae bacterium]
SFTQSRETPHHELQQTLQMIMSEPIPFRVALCVLIGFSLWFSDQAYPEEVLRRSNIEIDVGLSTWISQGKTEWSHNASSASTLLGNPTSKLEYKDDGTNVVELSGKAMFAKRWFVRANYGFGDIGGGRLTDDDFLAADGGQPSLRTHSDIKGDDIWYVNGDVGVTVLNFAGHRGSLDLFMGYQYWREKHVATGVTQVICTQAGSTVDLDPAPGIQPLCNPGAGVSAVGQTVITNTATWSSLRMGVQSEFHFTRRFSIEGKAAFIPYTSLSNKDVHHLRPDLQQNPSFSMSGTGIGANLEGNARFMVVKGLFASVGYRFWWNRVTDGTWRTFPVNGPSETFNLNEFETIRHGVTLGLTYSF